MKTQILPGATDVWGCDFWNTLNVYYFIYIFIYMTILANSRVIVTWIFLIWQWSFSALLLSISLKSNNRNYLEQRYHLKTTSWLKIFINCLSLDSADMSARSHMSCTSTENRKRRKKLLLPRVKNIFKKNPRACSLVVSDLHSETKGSRFESHCQLCTEVSFLQ